MSRLDRRNFLKTSAAAAGSLAIGQACSRKGRVGRVARRDRRPNVVVVMTDDQRWDCMSCVPGYDFLKTPNMDRIAAEGARFANMFVTTSLCSPSRASFLSGLYAHTHGVVDNFTDYPTDLPSYPRRLQEAGYETAYIGKWHMGEQSDERRPGFDYWVTHKGQGKYFDNTFNINGNRQDVRGYYTHRLTDLVVDWLKMPHRRPFLLVVGHKAPHGPFEPEPKYVDIFDDVKIERPKTANDTGPDKPAWVKERVPTWHGIDGPLYEVYDYNKFLRSYLATIKSVDDSVGVLYETLDVIGELDNTLFVYTSDNGFLLGEHGAIDKRTMHEESIRVPMLVRYPELVREFCVIEQQVLNIDQAPSIVEICGARPFDKCHGMSWKPLLEGRSEGWRTSWYYEYNYEKQFPYTPNVRGVRTDEWKYIRYPDGQGGDQYIPELYDMKNDPLEMKNLAQKPEYADQCKELRAELDRLIKVAGGWPDKMPVDPDMKMELPEKSIR